MKLSRLILLVALVCFFTPDVYAAPEEAPLQPLNISAFQEIPVLHEGRIKPLASFARAYLLAFSGKSNLPGMSAGAWLAELLFDEESAYARAVFNLPNPDVVDALSLTPNPEHHYSFNQLAQALDDHQAMIKSLDAMDDARRTPAQRQLLELYNKVEAYALLSESLTLLQPRFKIEDSQTADELQLPRGQDLTYLDMMPHENALFASIEKLKHKKPQQLTDAEKQRAFLAYDYTQLTQHQLSSIFRILPPQWPGDGDAWFAPWPALLEGHGSPQSAAYLDLWKQMAAAYAHHDNAAWQAANSAARGMGFQLAGDRAAPWRLKLEVFYVQINAFTVVLAFYIIGFVVLLAGFFAPSRFFYPYAAATMVTGAVLQFIAIAARILIMARPPVATLYETTLFVSFIAVVLSLLFERKRRDGIGLIVGSIIGSVLLFISTRYAADGDTMEMLVAVLNTNFWLATHVVAVTMGYGCSLVAGTLGHIYLLKRWARPDDTKTQNNLINTILAVALIAAFFATLGTILGGIWADQSWGRFWGWDPKETWALITLLCYIALLHGRLAGWWGGFGLAVGAVLCFLSVLMSWYGVNFILGQNGKSLHSYGLSTGGLSYATGFAVFELIFVAGILWWNRKQRAVQGSTAKRAPEDEDFVAAK